MLILALLCLELATACLPTNPTPVIGILTQPVEAAYQTYGDQYVPASYVKWVESAGARVFFVHYDASQSDLKLLLKTQLNGLVFAGGDADITDGLFAETSRYLLQLVMDMNNQADYFPLWATCQGMQQVSIYTADDNSVLVNRTAENILFPLNFTNDAQFSRTMSQAPQQVWDALTYETITVNNHNYGVDPMSFKTNANLYNNYTILATNVDVYGNEFVSYFEGFSLPIYGSQFHPEKNAFEWNQAWSVLDGAHIPDAIVTMQYLSEFLVRESIKSQHNFTTGVSTAGELAYTVSATYTGNIDPYWEQIYFFDDYPVDSKQFL